MTESTAIIERDASSLVIDDVPQLSDLAQFMGYQLEELETVGESEAHEMGSQAAYRYPPRGLYVENVHYLSNIKSSGKSSLVLSVEGDRKFNLKDSLEAEGIPLSGDILNVQGFYLYDDKGPGIQVYNPDEKPSITNVCSVMGYLEEFPVDVAEQLTGKTFEGQSTVKLPVKARPRRGKVLSNLRDYNKSTKTHTEPHKDVLSLGLLGSRGKSCAECIRCGEHQIQIEEGGEMKTKYCQVSGQVYFFITQIETRSYVRNPKGKGFEPQINTYTIEQLFAQTETPCKGIIVNMRLSAKTGLDGIFDVEKKEYTFRGFNSLIRTIKLDVRNANRKDKSIPLALMNPSFYKYKIGIQDIEGKKYPYYHFETLGVINGADIPLFQEGQRIWQSLLPKTETEILNLDDFDRHLEQPEVTPSENVEMPIRNVTQTIPESPDDLTEDDIQF